MATSLGTESVHVNYIFNYTSNILHDWNNTNMGYTCFGFTSISFQCFKPIPSVQFQLKFSYHFQLHSITNFFSAFTTNQFSLCPSPGPPFCSAHLCHLLNFFLSFALHSLHQCIQATSSENKVHVLTEAFHWWKGVGKAVEMTGIVSNRFFYHGYPLGYVFLNTGGSAAFFITSRWYWDDNQICRVPNWLR